MSPELSHLALTRPLAVVDLESTGVHPRHDRIVEIAVVRVEPNGQVRSKSRRLNPGVPIPPEATAVHGITDADVRDAPSFADVAEGLAETLAGCDLAGFGIARFDLPLLEEEFRRAGVTIDLAERRVVDALRIFHAREPRDLAAACRLFLGEEHVGHHGAEADALVALRVLDAELARYDDLPRDVAALAEAYGVERDPSWIDRRGKLVWKDGEPALGFGQHRGKTLGALAAEAPDYLEWILSADFDDDVKAVVAEAKRGGGAKASGAPADGPERPSPGRLFG